MSRTAVALPESNLPPMTMTGSTPPPIDEKSTFVRDMFACIAPRYDTANRVLTAGLDESWRRRAIALLTPPCGGSILDLCCGTGDVVFHLLRTDPTLRVTGIDFCPPMLDAARSRAHKEARGEATFVEGDVMSLPFDGNAFDGATMGFSLRNVVEIDRVLREVLRVLRPGARFINLDVSKPPNPMWRRLFGLYFYGVVPLLGGFIGGSKQAYTYLPSSLTHHPNADALRDRFTRAGFTNVGYVPLMGGAIAVHYGTKP